MAHESSGPQWWVDHPDQLPVMAPPSRRSRLIRHRAGVLAALVSVALVGTWLAVAAVRSCPSTAIRVFAPDAASTGDLDREHDVRFIDLQLPAPLTAALLGPIADPLPAAAVALVTQPRDDGPKLVPTPEKLVIKRFDVTAEEDLRKQLLSAPEISLDPAGLAKRSSQVAQFAATQPSEFTLAAQMFNSWPDLRGLPFRAGADCQLAKDPAENLQAMSRKVRSLVAESVRKNAGKDATLDPELLRSRLADDAAKDFQGAGAVPCLMQMLQPEGPPIRRVLVEHLATFQHRSAAEALARIALYDLSEAVRDEAIRALARRPRDEYRRVLLAGLRHVWTPVANHAAEALVALRDEEALPALRQLLDEPDPSAPVSDPVEKTQVAPQMVRIHHVSNCLMCHASSRSPNDLVRARVPGQDQQQTLSPYGGGKGASVFIRADVTYLRQDFSVLQSVDRPGSPGTVHRFDYLVRTVRVAPDARAARGQHKKADPGYPQREAVAYAVKELSRLSP